MNQCKICNSKDNLETHHIQDQQFADKNKKHNLVSLCKKMSL